MPVGSSNQFECIDTAMMTVKDHADFLQKMNERYECAGAAPPSNTAGVTKRSAIDFFRSYARDLRKDTRVPTAILFKNEHPPVAYFGKVPPDEIVRWLSTREPAWAIVRFTRGTEREPI